MATTLIKTITSSGASTVSFEDGTSSVVLDDTYKLYLFTFVDINPATDSAEFQFQSNAAGASGYNEESISTVVTTSHNESGGDATEDAVAQGLDQINDSATSGGSALGTGFLNLAGNIGNGGDESCAGELLLFDPSNTTFVTQWLSRFNTYRDDNYTQEVRTAGCFNITAAIDEIQFKMSSGNFDGTISLWGVA
tara:strand:+ start:589 stop:1170 length:582 start_codon:yes stop_codon:yes gene_type:complete